MKETMLNMFKQVKAIAKERECKVDDVLALAPNNDPFYVGRDSQIRQAEWAAEIWKRMGSPQEVHVRRMHYYLVTVANIEKPWKDTKTGMSVYVNTLDDWGKLGNAAKYARYLGLIPFSAFIDRRNPPAEIRRHTWADEGVDYIRDRMNAETMMEELTDAGRMVNGWNFMPYHTEIWVEKSTMNDVLMPIAKNYGATLVAGLGELSITHAHGLMERVQEYDVPTRVFYISDFDPAGAGMPISVARKIEWFNRLFDDYDNLDIKLKPIALTLEQCEQFELPRTPIKATDARKGTFEAKFGGGATELDALEALHPGELDRIVRAEIRPYFDKDMWRKVVAVNTQIQNTINEAIEPIKAELQEQLDKVDLDAVEEVLANYKEGLPSPIVVDEDDDEWLYNAGEAYGKTLLRYKRYKAYGRL